MTHTVEVASLHYYPIKSCGGIDAATVGCNEFGIEYDREWMLVGSKGQFLSQRTHPELARVQTRLETDRLIAAAPGMGELAVSLAHDSDAEEVPVTLWKKPGTAIRQGTDADDYFSEYLRRDTRLLRVRQPRAIKPECRIDGASEHTAFADGFPLMLTAVSSLAALQKHIDQPVAIDRFRSNIVVEGAPAYDEDYWREIHIGGLRAFVVRACARCPIPNIDQAVGELPKERAVSEALRATRQGIDPVNGEKGEFFGQNIVHACEPGMAISVGDPVTVVVRADQRNWRAA